VVTRSPEPGSCPRVERSLYERANGYNYEAVKIFMPAGSKTERPKGARRRGHIRRCPIMSGTVALQWACGTVNPDQAADEPPFHIFIFRAI
jgi:hypothetical protein